MIDFNSKNFVQLGWVKDMSEVTKVIEPLTNTTQQTQYIV